MKAFTRTKRICVVTGVAVVSMLAVPTVAGATDPACYTGCTPPAVSPNTVLPPAQHDPSKTAATTSAVNGSSSLPFTGADVGELAAIGMGAVVIGRVLTRRRRQAS
jgi:hypothetical protein